MMIVCGSNWMIPCHSFIVSSNRLFSVSPVSLLNEKFKLLRPFKEHGFDHRLGRNLRRYMQFDRDAPGGFNFSRGSGSASNSLSRTPQLQLLKNISLPLFDVSVPLEDFGMMGVDSGDGGKMMMTSDNTLTPLPSSHLPLEVSTLNVYGMELQSPSHIRMMREAERVGKYGHLVHRKDENELVGAIGCAGDVISCSFQYPNVTLSDIGGDDDVFLEDGDPYASGATSVSALMRGSFRFVVREVKSTFPYPVVIVDELSDIPYGSNEREALEAEEGEDDDDDDYDIDYNQIPAEQLLQRCLSAMDAIVKMKINIRDTTPLEDMILESQGLESPSKQKSQVEELAAVFDVFRLELVEMNDRTMRAYAIGMMAVEIAEVSYEDRAAALITTDGAERLRMVLQIMEKQISMERAKKLAEELTSSDEETQLQVGVPSMPQWVKSIDKGTRLEYFWNEEEGWCSGIVQEKLVLGDEILMTVKFDDDGTTHRIPFTAEEKVRWRPL